jgi:hypothetical protein
MNRVQCAPTREICVCWDMTSATRMAHGSSVDRIARLRARAAYQPRSARDIAAASAEAVVDGYPCVRSTVGKGSP